MLEHVQQRLIQTVKCKKSRYEVHHWIIYARLSVFDSYHDTVVIMISNCDSSTVAELYLYSSQHVQKQKYVQSSE